MTSLTHIELILNIEIDKMILHDGLKKKNKNQFYWIDDQYCIINLSKDKWIITSCNEQVTNLLIDHVFRYTKDGAFCSTYGYFRNMIINANMDDLVGYLNKRNYDNRSNNLINITQNQ